MSKWSMLTDGLVKNNPVFVLVLGMCPTLATTSSAINGLEMGIATMFVLILSNIVISLLAPAVPDKVHIPVYIVVIATFVTVLQLLMQAFVPSVYETLGLFIPLIVVNCIVLGRSRNRFRIHPCPHGDRSCSRGSRKRLRLRIQVHPRRRNPRFRNGARCLPRPGISDGPIQ